MARKYALLIGNDCYEDDYFAPLTVPQSDIESLASVLSDPEIGGFDSVEKLLNASMQTILDAIGDLFSDKLADDLLLLYFSGHGALDSTGQLYLAVARTSYKRLSTSSISSWLIKNEMNKSRSHRQVLILDCCYAGAFSRNAAGSKSGLQESAVDQTTFDVKGYGREILVSSSATQRSWEGNTMIGDTDKSLFTHFMTEGLRTGAAAPHGEPAITLGQLYDYVHDKVVDANPNMTPQRWVEAQKDTIVIARNPNPIVNTNLLPEDLLADLDNPKNHVRDGAVRELGRLAKSGDQSVVAAVKKVLTQQQRSERDIVVYRSIEEVLEATAGVVETIQPAAVNTVSNTVELKEHKVKRKGYVFAGIGLLLAILAIVKYQDFRDADVQDPWIEKLKELKTEENTKDSLKTVSPATVINRDDYEYSQKLFDDLDALVTNEEETPVTKDKPIRKPGTVFQDVLKDGSKGPEMVVIPQGSFLMGSPENEKYRNIDEGPQHRIEITKPFALGRYEVTLEAFKKYSDDANAVIEDGCWNWDDGEAKWKLNTGANWQKPGFKQDNTHPVVCVSWNDAKKYIKWLNQKTSGKPYRPADVKGVVA